MKIKLFLLGILLCLAAMGSRAADVSFTFQSSDTTPQGLKNVTLYPIGAPFTNGNGAIITRDWLSGTTDTNGQLVISNLYGGSYEGILEGSTRKTTNWYNFPVTNGFISSDRYAGPQTNGPDGIIGYSQAQSDSRYVQTNDGRAITLASSLTAGSLNGQNLTPNTLIGTDAGKNIQSYSPGSGIAVSGGIVSATNVPATAINPNAQTYSSTGLYCSIIITNNSYTLTGASGTRTNSNNVSVDFSQANGTYGWCATCKGNGEDGVTNIGILTNSALPNWVCSYQWFGASFPTWIFYNTNIWIYSSSGATKTNAVLATGLPAPLGKAPGGGREDYLPDLRTSNYWKYLPGGIPSTVSFSPVYTTNIFPITASVYDPDDGLVKFPNVGPSQTSVRRANVDPPNQNYPADPGSIFVKGAGVIQRIEIMVSQFSPGQYRSNYWLQLFPDYGTNPTGFSAVNSNLMTFNVPITQLSSTRLDNPNGIGGLIGNSWSTAFWDVQTDGVVPFIKIYLKLKCPFTNNFFARVIDAAANSEAGGSFFSTVDYQIDRTGQLNYPFRDWRLHGVNARYPVATITPKLDGTQTDWSQTQITMFAETNKPGVVIALLGGLSGLGNGPMETANWEWICDGAYPPFQMEGEDAFFAPYEAWITAPYLNATHGLNNRLGPLFQNPTDFDAYRLDYQVSWQHDIKAVLTSAPGTYGDITTIYYAAP